MQGIQGVNRCINNNETKVYRRIHPSMAMTGMMLAAGSGRDYFYCYLDRYEDEKLDQTSRDGTPIRRIREENDR
eukprot:4478609-Amphidinium_carterae.1